MAQFNVVTNAMRDGRPYGFNIETPLCRTVDELIALLVRDKLVPVDRVNATGGRVRMGLGVEHIGQLTLATPSRAGARNLDGHFRRASVLPDAR